MWLQQIKEELHMKNNLRIVNSSTSSAYIHYRKPYPNAVEPSYFLDKLIDGILAVTTVMGSVTILFFLLTM